MGLADLFKPKWKNPDVSIRRQAVEKIQDDKILDKILTSETDEGILLVALKKSNSPKLLSHLRQKSPNPEIRRAADRRITEIAEKNTVLGKRVEAVKLLRNTDILHKIALNDREAAVRVDAVIRINDQQTLAEFVEKEKESFIRKIAAAKITRQDLLARLIKKEEDSSIRYTMVSKLEDQDLLKELAMVDSGGFVQNVALGRITEKKALEYLSLNGRTTIIMSTARALMTETEESIIRKITRPGMGVTLMGVHTDVLIRRIQDQKILKDIALNQSSSLAGMSANYQSWERQAALDNLEDQEAIARIAIEESVNGNISLFIQAVQKLRDKSVIQAVIDAAGKPEFFMLKMEMERRLEIVNSMEQGDYSFKSLYSSLLASMDEAYSWGKENGWPLMEDYPQWQMIRETAYQIYDLDPQKGLQTAADSSVEHHPEYPGMLNHFFRDIGGWMP